MSWKTSRIEEPFPLKPRPLPAPGQGPKLTVMAPITEITPEAFQRDYVQANRPVVLSGVFDDLPALSQWSVAALTARAGDAKGEVMVSKNGLYPDYCTEPSPMLRVQMTLAEFTARATGAPGYTPVLTPQETYYIYGRSFLYKAYPALLEELPIPTLLPTEWVDPIIWVSTPGCITPLHYDLVNGMLVQVQGTKQILLFGPDQEQHLYFRGDTFPGLDNKERQSQVDVNHPDLSQFPDYAKAEGLMCVLKPGDALFLPSNWAHEVETLELSISAGFSFEGGTATSKFAALSETLKREVDKVGDQDPLVSLVKRLSDQGQPLSLDSIQALLVSDPALMMSLVQSPLLAQIMADPSLLQILGELVQERAE